MHTRSLHIEIARQHLAALDDPNASHIFVCIPEAPDARGGVRHVFGPLEVARDRLEAEQRAGERSPQRLRYPGHETYCDRTAALRLLFPGDRHGILARRAAGS